MFHTTRGTLTKMPLTKNKVVAENEKVFILFSKDSLVYELDYLDVRPY